MTPKSRRVRLSFGLFCVCLIAIGVMVWPPPKDALAETITFRARVDWNGRQRNDNGIQLRLTTRAVADGQPLEVRAMTFVSHVEGVSYYQFVYAPDQRARFWDVTLVNVRQHRWVPTSMLLKDGQEILAGVISDLDASFICIDQ